MLIELVSHAWSAEQPHVAAALTYQLSSLVIDEPKTCTVRAVVCYDPKDERTRRVLKWFWERTPCNLVAVSFPARSPNDNLSYLGRRSIGRNWCAKRTEADIVWYADADQVYRDGIFDRLAALDWPDGAAMVYPREIMIHRDHATGDRRTASVAGDPQVVDIDPSEFVPKRYRKAIGGVQIVRGDLARQHGYLGGEPKWQQPVAKPFGDFRDDVAYRKFCLNHGSIVGVDLPGMYRIRHTAVTYK